MILLRRRPCVVAALCVASMCACDAPTSGLNQRPNPALPGAGGEIQPPAVDASSTPPVTMPPGPPSWNDAGVAALDGSAVPDAACRGSFAGWFEAVQEVVFEGRGCTAKACHGEAKVGGLDLRRDAAWSSLVDVRSANSAFPRVKPGSAAESFLFLKLRAATEPGSVQVAGSPMPVGAPALTPNELEALRIWIAKGAPRTGEVSDDTKGNDVGRLLDTCAASSGPIKAEPLAPPAPDDGIQLVLPRYPVKAQSEVENCTPLAYDFTDKVPAQYKDLTRNVMYINGSHVRQDPQSHHLILWNPAKTLNSVSASDTMWRCRGGAQDGKPCNAQKGSNECGEGGACASETTAGSLCGIETLAFGSGTAEDIFAGLLGLGPKPLTFEDLLALGDLLLGSGMPAQIANAQAAEQYVPPIDGVYMELPLSGILWFNSHAFNLTETDTILDARVNWFYAKKRERELRRLSNTDYNNIAHGQPPFTRETYCAKHEVPQNYSLAVMTGHTHRHGEHFWVTDAKGQKIYESFDYKDPAYTEFKPWLEFDQPDPSARTLEFCATFNNGVRKDGSPDVDLVTRASRMPERGTCTPVACVAGNVTAACMTDRDCDSAPGTSDGDCDACAITAGQTTENEMFVLMNWYVLPPTP
jgi:hypothetical protein